MITKSQAQAKIQSVIDSIDGPECEIINDATIEKEWGWVFFYSSKKFLETNDYRYALAGNAPYIVNRHDGSIHETGTAHAVEHYIDLYEGNNPDNKHIVISGWRPGFQKIQCTKIIREFMDYGLGESKRLTDRILDKEEVHIQPKDDIDKFNQALYDLGAECRIEKML